MVLVVTFNFFADLFQSQDRLRHFLDRDRWQRTRQLVDPQAQVMKDILALDQQAGVRLRTKIGDAEANKLVGIITLRVNFRQ